MKNYELLCVLPGTLGEDETTPIAAEVAALLSSNGGSNVTTEDRGKSRLAYPMKHIRYGYFTLFTFQAEPEALSGIQAKLRLMTTILRAMINEFNPEMRKEKDATLAKLAKERAETQAASEAEANAPAADAVVVMPKAVEAMEESSAKKTSKKASEKPTDAGMAEIEKKLDEVLDSPIEEV